MKVRSLLKNALKKADKLVDREADKLELLVDSFSNAGTLIEADAKVFAKSTLKNLKVVAKDVVNVSKSSSLEIKNQIKKDVEDVKEIAEKRMIETRDIIKEKLDNNLETQKTVIEE